MIAIENAPSCEMLRREEGVGVGGMEPRARNEVISLLWKSSVGCVTAALQPGKRRQRPWETFRILSQTLPRDDPGILLPGVLHKREMCLLPWQHNLVF